MKCQECSYENLSHSSYCQECGTPLKKSQSKKDNTSPENSIRHEIERLDDVIFKPKKNGGFVSRAIKIFFVLAGIGFIGLIGLGILVAVFSDDNTSYSTDPVETDLTSFPLGYLEIQELDSEWVGQQFYISGVLKNSYSTGASDVKVRVDFYKDENEEELFDTRYITILGVSANGAYSFDEPVYINPYDGRFWYVTQIESAEYLQ